MLKWLSELTPEFYIFFGLLLIIFIFLIIQFIILRKVNDRVGSQDFEILESITEQDKAYFYYITVVNKSLSPNYINHIGFIRGNVRHILEDKNNPIAPRNKYQTKIAMDTILEITNKNIKKFKKVTLFAENEIGLRKNAKPKKLNKYILKKYKAEKKAVAKAKKDERFETGNYRFDERFFLIFKLFFRPLYKVHQKIKQSTNRVLKESEIRRVQKSEHDKIEFKLNETAAKVNELRVKEETYKENRTRETELELLKQQKAFEIESLKQAELNKAFEKQKAKINSINVKEEVKKYFEEEPITFNNINNDLAKFEKVDKVEKVEKEEIVEDTNNDVVAETIKEVVEKVEKIDYNALKVAELKELAKEKEIKNYTTMRKAELIIELEKLEEN